jgi:hypothetical protein
MMKKIAAFILTLFVVWSCSDSGPSGPNVDNFDREAVLENWADNIVIPAFTNFSETTDQLHASAEAFEAEPTQERLDNLRERWRTAYLAFQHVSMFEMGQAMDLRYRENLNIYPTDAAEIESSISSGTYNLTLPSLSNSQGFPALDYMLHGVADSDAGILAVYTGSDADKYLGYLTDLTERIDGLTGEVLENWTSGYRDIFVSNSGNGANSSLDMMVNDYIFYYEKSLRAGKIGIPAGVFSGSPLSSHVEAYYSDGLSKALFNEALTASINFFNGVHFGNDTSGQSLSDYLDYLNTMKEGTDLSQLINDQFETARQQGQMLNDDFAAQVEADNTMMLATYDELQQNVVYMKVDMLQALNINVDYVDADGD